MTKTVRFGSGSVRRFFERKGNGVEGSSSSSERIIGSIIGFGSATLFGCFRLRISAASGSPRRVWLLRTFFKMLI